MASLLASCRGRAALATLVKVEGSSFRRPGARLALLGDGRRAGSISGGCLESDLLLRLEQVRQTGKPERVRYDTTRENDLVWGVGLGCHGIATIYIEAIEGVPRWCSAVIDQHRNRSTISLSVIWESTRPESQGTWLQSEAPADSLHRFDQVLPPPPQILLCGAGDDAQAVARLAHELGWTTVVTDPRPGVCTAQRFPSASACIVCAPEEVVQRIPLDTHSMAVVMSHHYVHDVPFVRALLDSPVSYLGLLGPRKRAVAIAEAVGAERSVPAERILEKLHAPVGLDIGGDGPEAVALSIIAEIHATLARRDGRPLRNRTAPIHEA